MRRLIPAAVAAVALTAVAASTLAAPTSAAPASAPAVAAKQIKTKFQMGGYAYGTRVTGDLVPLGSAETGYSVMGCNRFAGKTRTNFVEDTEIPGLGTVSGVKTKLWTEQKGATTTQYSMHSIAKIELLDTPLGSLDIRGVSSLSQAFSKAGKFGGKVENSIAKIVFTPPVGDPQVLDIPAPNQPIIIPGLLRLDLGKEKIEKGADFARAFGTVLRLQFAPTNTVAVIGQTAAKIDLARTRGLFNGYGAGLEVRVLDNVAQVGRNAFQPIPCVGSDGDQLVNELAGADLTPLLTTGDVAGVQRSGLKPLPYATVAGKVAEVNLGDGQLIIKVAQGVADVRRTASGGLDISTKGTHVGEIIANGQSYDLDQLGEIEIPGLAKLEGKVVEKLRNGVKVIALRVTLLDGTLAQVDLGVAKAKIRPTTR